MADNQSNRIGNSVVIGALRFVLPIAVILLAIYVFLQYCAKLHDDDIAQSLTCASNLKAIGLGFQQYVQDYDMNLPDGIRHSASKNSGLLTGLGWSSQTYPYVKREYVYKCPDDMSKCTSRDPIISYAYNLNAAKNDRLSKWTQPSVTVLLFEVSNANAPVAFWPDPQQITSGELAPVGDGTSANLIDGQKTPSVRLAAGDIGNRPLKYSNVPRHSDHHGNDHKSAMYLFGDGHVMWFAPKDVSSGEDASTSGALQSGGSTGKARAASDSGYMVTFSTR